MEKYCVIGRHCGRHVSGVDRKWFDTEAEAAKHAEGLVRRNGWRPDPDGAAAFVVKVALVVEPVAPVNVRPPEPEDF
jgi:hypothetical protein